MSAVAEIIQAVNVVLKDAVTTNVQSVIEYIQGPFFMLVGVYIALWGMAHFMGAIKEPLMDATKRFLKVFVIMILALKWGEYNTFIVKVFTEIPDDFASAALKGLNTSTGTGQGKVVEALDDVFGGLWNIGATYWEKGSIWPWKDGPIVACVIGLLVYILAIFVTAYATFLILLSKIALAVLIGIGPLFIISLLFEATRQYFEKWLGFLVNYALVMVFTVAVTGLLVTVLTQLYNSAYAEAKESGVQLLKFGTIAITCIAGSLLFPQILGIASTLGGGVSLSSMGVPGFAGKAVKGAAGKAGGAVGGAVGGAAGFVARERGWTASWNAKKDAARDLAARMVRPANKAARS